MNLSLSDNLDCLGDVMWHKLSYCYTSRLCDLLYNSEFAVCYPSHATNSNTVYFINM